MKSRHNPFNHLSHRATAEITHPVQKFRIIHAQLKSTIQARDHAIASITNAQKDAARYADDIKKLRKQISDLVPELGSFEQCQKQAQFIGRQA